MNSQKTQLISKKVYAQKTIEYILYGFIVIGIVLSIIANNYQNKTKNQTVIRSWIQTSAAGYIMSAVSLLLTIPFAIKFNTNIISNTNISNQFIASIYKLLIFPLPIYITVLVFIFASVQILMFQDRLVTKHVAKDYFTWINTFSFLVSIQTFLLAYYSVFNKSNNPNLRYVIYLLGLFNFIILGITQVTLQFFSTDG